MSSQKFIGRVRPILIYEGELSNQISRENFFSHIIKLDDLLKI